MNRRIGRLIQIGLFAALPVGWSASALAQNTTGSAVSADTGINPLPRDDSSSLTKDQRKAGDIDQNLGNPGSSVEHPGSLGVGDKSDTMGTSGSSGSPIGEKADQKGSQMSGSSGAVPGQIDVDDVQRSSGQEAPKRKGSTKKSTRSSTSDQTNLSNPDKSDFGSSRTMPGDSSDITK